MFISLLWVCTYWEEYQYVAAYWAVSDLSGYSPHCVRGMKGLSQQRSWWEKMTNPSLIFPFPGSLNCSWLWCVTGSGLRQGWLAEKDESRSGDINKSKGWHGIWNMWFECEYEFAPVIFYLFSALQQKTSEFVDLGGEQYFVSSNYFCVSPCVDWKTAAIMPYIDCEKDLEIFCVCARHEHYMRTPV